MNDLDLVARILAKDQKALFVMYQTYVPELGRFIASRIQNVKDGEEVLQDILYAFLEALRDFSGKSSIRTFLFSIAHHKVVDYYRKKKLKHIVFSQMPQLESLVSPFLAPEDSFERHLLQQKIGSVLDGLLPKYKKALLGKYMDNLSVSEVATLFAVSLKSAESILFRAKRAFVKAFIAS